MLHFSHSRIDLQQQMNEILVSQKFSREAIIGIQAVENAILSPLDSGNSGVAGIDAQYDPTLLSFLIQHDCNEQSWQDEPYFANARTSERRLVQDPEPPTPERDDCIRPCRYIPQNEHGSGYHSFFTSNIVDPTRVNFDTTAKSRDSRYKQSACDLTRRYNSLSSFVDDEMLLQMIKANSSAEIPSSLGAVDAEPCVGPDPYFSTLVSDLVPLSSIYGPIDYDCDDSDSHTLSDQADSTRDDYSHDHISVTEYDDFTSHNRHRTSLIQFLDQHPSLIPAAAKPKKKTSKHRRKRDSKTQHNFAPFMKKFKLPKIAPSSGDVSAAGAEMTSISTTMHQDNGYLHFVQNSLHMASEASTAAAPPDYDYPLRL